MEVRYVEKQGWEAQRIAQEFAKLGLSSALLLNGGALVALPPLMQWLTPVTRSEAPQEAIWFLGGTIATAIAIVVAYYNWMLMKEQQYLAANIRALELDCEFQGRLATTDKDYVAAKKKAPKFVRFINMTQIAAVIAAIAAYVCFGIGVYSFLHLAQKNANPSVSVAAHNLRPVSPKPSDAQPSLIPPVQKPKQVHP